MPPPEHSPPDAETWRRLRPLLDRLLDTPVESRADALSAAGLTPKDRELVMVLLEDAEDDSSDRLSRPPLEVDTVPMGELAEASRAGDRVGPWELRRRLGRGGMGQVWAVVRVDGPFTQRGALKRLRQGPATDEQVARFERERQVLASIEDPSIARLIDGGIDDHGQPYLVMEYVDGEAIDDWCRHHRLPLERRVALLARTARAVDAAHERRIVHRDLKPSNVLVDAEGRPRLIDFGVAKALDPGGDELLVTQDVARYLTPLFASPEQFAGLVATAASDVYSLGALAYSILVGRPPLQIAGLGAAEAVRCIEDEEPEPPSRALRQAGQEDGLVASERGASPGQLARALAGDLDAVLLKCLRKEPERRYARAGELADELDRWLAGDPVRARRDTAVYRARRFVLRHRALAALTTLVLVLLAVGLFVAVAQRAKLARQTQELAERTRGSEALLADLRASIHGLGTQHYTSLAAIPGTERVLAKLTRTLAAIAGEQNDPELLLEAVRAHWLYGINVWGPYQAAAGRPEDAANSIHKARRLGQELVARPDAPLRAFSLLSEVMTPSSTYLHLLGDLDGALAQAREDEAWVAARMGLSAEELVGPSRALDAASDIGAPLDRLWLSWVALRNAQVSVLRNLGRSRAALGLARETLGALREARFADLINDAMRLRDVRVFEETVRSLELDIGESSLVAQPEARDGVDQGHRSSLSQLSGDRLATLRQEVRALTRGGRIEEARALVVEALQRAGGELEGAARSDRPSPERARLRRELAWIELAAGRAQQARKQAGAALDELERCLAGRPVTWIEEQGLRATRLLGGHAATATGDIVEGARLLGLVLDSADRCLVAHPFDWSARLHSVEACCALARVQSGAVERGPWLDRAEARLDGDWTDAPNSPVLRELRGTIQSLR